MASKLNCKYPALVAFVLLVVASLSWQALAGSKKTDNAQNQSAGTAETELSGEELWTMNCQRCHNIRPPTMYSNAQWDVIVHHMRVRANITGKEQRAIVEFLKSAK